MIMMMVVLMMTAAYLELENLKVLSSTWLANNISVPSTPLVTGRGLQQGTNNWKLLQVRLLVKKIK